MFDNFFVFDMSGEIIVSLIVIGLIILFAFVIFFLAKRQDPLKAPKGLLLIAELGVRKADELASSFMNSDKQNFGAYVVSVALYLGLCYFVGMTGLPQPVTSLAIPLTLSLCTFFLIHFTAARYNKWKYFKRFTEPVFIFLPINLVSMWSPLLSFAFRLFGNALSGYIVLSLVYWALENLSALIFSALPAGVNSIFIAPIITPVLHLYFDVFAGFIQIVVFIFLSLIFIAQEKPDEDLAHEISITNFEERRAH